MKNSLEWLNLTKVFEKKNVIIFDKIKEKMQTIQKKMLKKEQSCMELVQAVTRYNPKCTSWSSPFPCIA